jgi:uncharacterized damage-inducible protein DinB
MIDADYCRVMARYNRWQNTQLAGFLKDLPEAELGKDRGAFFGSILGTANHLLWGDWIWMSRFDGGPGPGGDIAHSVFICQDLAAWLPLREETDARISSWTDGLGETLLSGPFTWFSAAAEAEVTKPYAQCIIHFFNHQTHHRGQIHAMLTATGSAAPVSDIAFLPEDA